MEWATKNSYDAWEPITLDKYYWKEAQSRTPSFRIPNRTGDKQRCVALHGGRWQEPFDGPLRLDVLARMPKLWYLNLKNNALSGEIGAEVGESLRKVKFLNLEGNSLEGSIPWQLSKLQNMSFLSLNYNEFRPSVGKSIQALQDFCRSDCEGCNEYTRDGVCELETGEKIDIIDVIERTPGLIAGSNIRIPEPGSSPYYYEVQERKCVRQDRKNE